MSDPQTTECACCGSQLVEVWSYSNDWGERWRVEDCGPARCGRIHRFRLDGPDRLEHCPPRTVVETRWRSAQCPEDSTHDR